MRGIGAFFVLNAAIALACGGGSLGERDDDPAWTPGGLVEAGGRPAPVGLPLSPADYASTVQVASSADFARPFQTGELVLHHQRREGDRLAVWGVYENTTTEVVERPSVFIEYFDAQDRRLGLDTLYVDRDYHNPGARTPVTMSASPVPPHARAVLTVSGASGVGAWAKHPRGELTLVEQRKGEAGSSESRAGTLRWDGKKKLRFVRAHVAWFDTDGRVVGVESAYTEPSEVAPGQTVSFKVLYPTLAGPYERVEVVASGRVED